MRFALLTTLLVAVVALVAPLPGYALDGLFALSFALALVFLGSVTTRPRDALRAAPTWLLALAVLRVGVTVAATRRILVHGDAGGLVRALGSLAADSVVVGLVGFSVIALVQLLVVARGGERVAEVAARFALDAMPGRQLALDADVRSGALPAGAAAGLREDLARESSFLGAMDGALKFVRGEVVASLAVLAVSLLGGFVVGTTQRGLSAGDALSRYTMLSVGEALATQIPGLASSIAAGVLVTRGDDGGVGPGRWFASLPSRPALAVAGAALLLLAVVPGLPFVPLALVGGLALGGAALLRDPAPKGVADVAVVVPAAARASWSAALVAARSRFEARTGFAFGRAEVRDGPGATARLELFGHDAGVVTGEGLADALVAAAPDLLTLETLRAELRRLHHDRPDAVPGVAPPAERLLPVLRDLLREGLSLRDLPGILEAAGDGEGAVLARVRVRLAREITALVAPSGELRAVELDPSIVSVLRGALRGDRLVLSRSAASDVADSLTRALAEGRADVVLLPGDLRDHGAGLVDVPARFVAPEELLPHVAVTVVRATMGAPGA